MKKLICFLFVVLIFAGCKKDDEQTPVKSSEKKITGFVVHSVNGVINEEAKTITLGLPSGTGVAALTPTVAVSPKATVSPASGVAQDFTNPVPYTVTAEDNTTATYTVTVNVPKSKEAKITSFAFESLNPAAGGTVNETDKTIAVSVPRSADLSALAPAIQCSAGATVSPASGVPQNFTGPVVYTVTSEDRTVTAVYTVQTSVIASSHKQITRFTFPSFDPAVEAVIDESAKTIAASVPYGTDVASLTPVIEASDGATVSPASGAARDFTNPVPYTVTAEDNTTATYTATVTVASFATAITHVSSLQLTPGAQLTLTGNFAADGNIVALEGGTNCTPAIVSQNATTIVAAVPADAAEGDYHISVTSNGTKATYPSRLTVSLPGIEITSVAPTTVAPGGSIAITGNYFAASGNIISFDGTGYTLNVISESTTEITAALPANTAEGTYTLKIQSGSRSETYTVSIEVTDPNAPRLISLNKTGLIRGLDDLVVKGVNLGTSSGRLYFRKEGSTGSFDFGAYALPDNGTTVTYTASGLESRPLGMYEVWFEASGRKTNTLTFTLVENTNPVPEITDVSSWNPCLGSNVTVTGANFGADAVIRLDWGGGMYAKPEIVSQSATEIVFKTDRLYTSDTYSGIEVVSGGQIGKKTGAFQVRYCDPEYTSVSPSPAAKGTKVTITGNNFANMTETPVITLGGKIAYGTVADNNTLTFTVPGTAAAGPTSIAVSGYGKTYFTIPSSDFEIID